MADLKIRTNGTTYTLQGVKKQSSRGSITYTPSETVWNDAVKGRCLYSYNKENTSTFGTYAIPLLSSAGSSGTKFLSMAMATGDSCPMAKEGGDWHILKARVDDKTLFACNTTSTVAVGDTLSWSEEYDSSSCTVELVKTIYTEGTLNIKLTLYDSNGNAITNISGYSNLTVTRKLNGSTKGSSVTVPIAVNNEFKILTRTSENELYFFYKSGSSFVSTGELNAVLSASAGFVLSNLDSRIKKIKATYTWTWA